MVCRRMTPCLRHAFMPGGSGVYPPRLDTANMDASTNREPTVAASGGAAAQDPPKDAYNAAWRMVKGSWPHPPLGPAVRDLWDATKGGVGNMAHDAAGKVKAGATGAIEAVKHALKGIPDGGSKKKRRSGDP